MSITPPSAAIDGPLATFAGVAEEYCALVDRRTELGVGHFLHATHVLLPRLYSAALALPAVEADDGDPDEGDGDGDDGADRVDVAALLAQGRRDSMPHETWRDLYRSLGALIGPERVHYAEVFDPYAEPAETPVIGSLADDLADVYRDLADGLAKWRRGEREAALWQWRFQFTAHWGEHATGALRALHTFASSHGGTFPGPRRAAS